MLCYLSLCSAGVAPEVTLAAYRILDCKGNGSDDDTTLAAILRAYEEGADVIS